MRKLEYGLAIQEASEQLMESDENVFLIGQGVISPWYVGNTTKGLRDKFGPDRVIDTPVSENAMTGAAIGAALAGMRPILIHPRVDFMMLAMEQIVNQAANWSYMFAGQVPVPITIRPIINRGGEQGAHHSQALQAFFMHVPGLKIVMPSTPYDAKGLLIASVRDNNPVIYIDDRWLYQDVGDVPEEMYSVPIGKGVVRRSGSDITVVATSYMAREAVKAAELLAADGIQLEVVDLRSLKPLDEDIILESVHKTGRLIVADAAWLTCGITAEIVARVTEKAFHDLKAPPVRITLPDAPAPSSGPVEDAYFVHAKDIVKAAKRLLHKG